MNFHYSFPFSNLPEHLYSAGTSNVIGQTELGKNLLCVRGGMRKGRKSKLYNISYDHLWISPFILLICTLFVAFYNWFRDA